MIPWSQIVEAVLLSFGTAAASVTIAKSKFFKPLRLWVGMLSMRGLNTAGYTMEQTQKRVLAFPPYQLISCPYCMSHWIAALGVAIFGTNVMGDPAIAGYVVTWLAIVALSSLIGGLIVRSYEE